MCLISQLELEQDICVCLHIYMCGGVVTKSFWTHDDDVRKYVLFVYCSLFLFACPFPNQHVGSITYLRDEQISYFANPFCTQYLNSIDQNLN